MNGTPTLAAQIAWVQSLYDAHVDEVKKRGDEFGEGTAMIAAVLESLRRAAARGE